jgi:membrane protein YdbS with pleckstrin-like domain
VSVPLLVYRLLMLAWALWLAYSLLKWLRWAWECYGDHGYWRKLVLWRKRGEQAKEIRP